MYWDGPFRAAFFGRWVAAGLPDPEAARHTHRSALAHVPRRENLPDETDGPLAGDIVNRVHAFGVVVGSALAGIVGVDDSFRSPHARWCGGFNLGVSLFDYVCDETKRGDLLAAVEPFRAFDDDAPPAAATTAATVPAAELRPEEEYLAGLATDLVAEFRDVCAGRLDWRSAFRPLYRAERAAAAGRAGTASENTSALREMLSVKSAGPFEIMALRAALARPDVDLELARSLGYAVGSCYLLVDDARDLWADLDSGAWNLFLLEVADRMPSLLSAHPTPLRDAAIIRVLLNSGVVGKLADQAFGRLLTILDDLTVEQSALKRHLALLTATMAAW